MDRSDKELKKAEASWNRILADRKRVKAWLIKQQERKERQAKRVKQG